MSAAPATRSSCLESRRKDSPLNGFGEVLAGQVPLGSNLASIVPLPKPETPDPELEGFLALLATRRAARTVEAYRRDLTHLSSWLRRPLGSATTEDLERYVAELRAAGLAPATISRRVAAIRSFFRHQAL